MKLLMEELGVRAARAEMWDGWDRWEQKKAAFSKAA